MLKMPKLRPVAMSVYKRSPTMAQLVLLKAGGLQGFLHDAAVGLADDRSGRRPVLASIKAMIAPMSGAKPVSVGQLKSGWVAIYGRPARTKSQTAVILA